MSIDITPNKEGKSNNYKNTRITDDGTSETMRFSSEFYIDYREDEDKVDIIHNISYDEKKISELYIEMYNNSVEKIVLTLIEDESHTDILINATNYEIIYGIRGKKYGAEEIIISSKIKKVEEVDKTTFNHSIKEGNIERKIKIDIDSSNGDIICQLQGEDNFISILINKNKAQADYQIEKRPTSKSSVTLGAIGEHSDKSLKIPRVNTSPNKNCCDTPTA